MTKMTGMTGVTGVTERVFLVLQCLGQMLTLTNKSDPLSPNIGSALGEQAGSPSLHELRVNGPPFVGVLRPKRIRGKHLCTAYALPAQQPRLVQEAEGIRMVPVNGEVMLEEGKHTRAFPGQVVRSV